MMYSNDDDILRELSIDELHKMLRHLKAFLPRSVRGHHLLYNYLKNLKAINEGIKLGTLSYRWQPKFFGHRNGNIENCTYVAISPENDYWINLCTVEKTGTELLECIAKTNRINWLQKPITISVDAEYFQDFNKIISLKRNDWIYDYTDDIFYLSKESVGNLPTSKIPEHLYIGPVPLDLAPMINETWKYKYNGSERLIKSGIQINGGTCLFQKSNNEPITWIITNDFFSPGFLQTIESNRRKGYGTIVSTFEMKRIVKEHNVDIYVYIIQGNHGSESMHRKLGFKLVNKCHWVGS